MSKTTIHAFAVVVQKVDYIIVHVLQSRSSSTAENHILIN